VPDGLLRLLRTRFCHYECAVCVVAHSPHLFRRTHVHPRQPGRWKSTPRYIGTGKTLLSLFKITEAHKAFAEGLLLPDLFKTPPWSRGSVLDHRSLPPGFESQREHIWRLFHLSLRFITFGGHSSHLAYQVHRSVRKTSIIIQNFLLVGKLLTSAK